MKRSPLAVAGLATALVAALAALPAAAQPMADPAGPDGGGDWAVMLGVGAAIRPTFDGSDRYRVSPIPAFSVVWRDTVALDATGLSISVRRETLRVGVGLTYSLGRGADDGVFGSGDSRLAGLGDVPAALGVRGFADWRVGPVLLGVSVVKFFADGNDGVLVDAGIGVPYRVDDRLALNARLSATWADGSYMRDFFGVTAAQSAASGYAAYRARAGLKDVSLGLGAQYRLTAHWSVAANVRVTQLLSSARDSPLSFADRSATAMATVAYRF